MMIKLFFIMFCLAGLCLAAEPVSCGEPVSSIERTIKELVVDLKLECGNLGKAADVADVVEKTLIKRLDTEFMVRQILGRKYWEESKVDQRDHLEALLKLLLSQQYAHAFSCQMLSNKITFYPLRDEVKKYTRVESMIQLAENQPLQIKYAMRCSEEQWFVYDIIISGLSLGQTFRSQFNRILKVGGIEALISYLERELEESDDEARH